MRLGKTRWAAALGLMLALPAPAGAATVSLQGNGFQSRVYLTFAAAGGEANDVTITATADTFLVADAGAPLTAGVGCQLLDAGHASCTRMLDDGIDIRLDDGDDRLVVDDSAYPPVSAFDQAFTDAGEGNDHVVLGVGGDGVQSGPGTDYVDAGGGSDSISGPFTEGPDGDTSPPSGSDHFIGGPGNDFVNGGNDDDLLEGGEGDDVLSGGGGADVLLGGPGDEHFTAGGAGDDVVDGGPGADALVGGQGNDRVIGGEGDDTLELPDFLGPNDIDTFYSPGTDTIEGGPGDDLMSAGRERGTDPHAPDRFDGGDGVDTVDYSQRTLAVTVTLDGAANDGAAGEGDQVVPNVERVVGSADSDSLTGDGDPNVLDGGPGDDLIDGGGGDDTLQGGVNDGGSDTLIGADGNDTLRGGAGDDDLSAGPGDDDLAGGGGSDSIDGAGGDDTIAGGPGFDRLAGGDGNDVLRGGDVVLVGSDSADDLDGGAGVDQLLGGPGNDTLDGGTGADMLSGEAGADTATYTSRGSDVTVTLDQQPNDGQDGEGDNVEPDVETVVGGAVEDTLTGDATANGLDGGSGEDYVDGGRGSDALQGGTGNDVVRSRDGSADQVTCGDASDYAIADTADTVRDCELVDRGGPRKLRLGGGEEVNPTRGKVDMRLPGFDRTVPLRDDILLPDRSLLDTTAGRLRLAAASDARGRRQSGTFYGGRFVVRQRLGGRRAITELKLAGGDFASCPRKGAVRATASARKRRVRSLWGRSGKTHRGRFRSRGRWSSATIRGTVWFMADRCDGTYTRVVRGTVVVHDDVRNRNVVLHAGDSYLARPPADGR